MLATAHVRRDPTNQSADCSDCTHGTVPARMPTQVSKRLQEEMCRQYHEAFGTKIVVLRPDYIVDGERVTILCKPQLYCTPRTCTVQPVPTLTAANTAPASTLRAAEADIDMRSMLMPFSVIRRLGIGRFLEQLPGGEC